MCGIAGIISHQQQYLSSIKKMTDIIAHRGPEGEGVYTWNNVALGHRRLSIIDLSELGKQPMHYLDKYAIIYNGEVYNYIELREELLQYNYAFRSHTDTEIILAAYDYWGKDCLNHFNGMFSFAILDKEKNILFCVRDRFGVKPFYYYEENGFFAFGSEIKVFTVLDGWKAVANKERIFEFLQFGLQDHTTETLFKNVYQLKGGYFLVYNLSTAQKNMEKWYDVRRYSKHSTEDLPEKKFKELFNKAIYFHLRADVKVGSCLSGGLDSSSVVLTVNEQLQSLKKIELQETVSSCFEDKKYDEQEYIDKVVEKANCRSHKVFPKLSCLYYQLPKIVWQQDEPFESTSILAQWEVFKKAKQENITVMLDGQGADELLAGYHSYYGVYLWQLIKEGRFQLLFQEARGIKKSGLYSNSFIAKEIIKNALPFSLWFTLKNLIKKEKKWINYKYTNKKAFSDISFSSLKQMSYSQITASNLPKLLHWEDRNSMTFSIEARVPFLDHTLVEYTYSLPDNKKIKNGITKKLLRNSMKSLLPMEVLERKDKMGFVTPEEVWVKENADLLRDDLMRAVEITNGFINKNILYKFNKIISEKQNFDFSIWRVLCLSNWIEVFHVRI